MTFAAVLLTGGESRRMGRDKATMEFSGRPLWERQLETLRSLLPEKILVSARTAPDWLPADVELLLDDPPSRGPLSGLTKALAEISTTHLIALAVDMPFMPAVELRKLATSARDGCGVVPFIGERAEPLAAIYPAIAAEIFKATLAGPDFSLQRIIRTLAEQDKIELYLLPSERAHCYRSVNTPSDLTL